MDFSPGSSENICYDRCRDNISRMKHSHWAILFVRICFLNHTTCWLFCSKSAFILLTFVRELAILYCALHSKHSSCASRPVIVQSPTFRSFSTEHWTSSISWYTPHVITAPGQHVVVICVKETSNSDSSLRLFCLRADRQNNASDSIYY